MDDAPVGSGGESSPNSGQWSTLTLFAAVASGYAAGGLLALVLAGVADLDAALFLPAGITVAALLRVPKHRWWVVLVAAALTEAALDLAVGLRLATVPVFVAANTVEPVVGAVLVGGLCGVVDLARRRHVVMFVAGAVVVAPVLGAAIAATGARLFEGNDLWTTFWEWWLGDALGVLVAGSAILAWGSSPDRRPLRSWWGAVTIGLSVVVATVVFGFTDVSLAFLLLGGLVLAGTALGVRAVTTCVLAVTGVIGIDLAVDPVGLAEGLADSTTVMLIKAQLGAFTIVGLLVAAEGFERDSAIRTAERSRSRRQLSEQGRRELTAVARLNAANTRLWGTRDLTEGFTEMLAATLDLADAQQGYVHLFDPERDVLIMKASHGFAADFLRRVGEISPEERSAAGRALRSGRQVFIPDVELDPAYAPLRAIAGRAGYRSALCTPLVGRTGATLGMLSAFYPAPRRVTRQQLALLDLYVQEAANYLERVALEDALRDNEQRLRLALYAAELGTVEFDRVVGVVHLDERARGLLAMENETTTVAVLATRIHPDDLPRIRAESKARLDPAARTPLEMRCRVVHPDARVRWIEARFRGGERVIGALRDITDLKAADDAVRASEERYRLLVDQASDGIFVADGAWRFVDVNPAGCQMLGFTRQEILSRALTDIVAPEDGPLVAPLVSQFEGGNVVRREWRFRRRDGSAFVGELVGRQLADGRLQGIVRDITPRLEAEQVLRESEARFRALFTSIDEGYCLCEMIVDAQGRAVDYRFLETNPLFEEMTGLVDAAGRTARQLVPDLEDEWIDTYARAALGGEHLRLEQGSAAIGRWFDVFTMPVEPHGRFAIVFKDTTEQRRTQQTLRESEQRFRTMADSLPLIVWLSDAEGRPEFVNQTFCDYYDTSRDELDGDWHIAIYPDDEKAYVKDFVAAVRSAQSYHGEVRVRRGDGEWRWLESWSEPRFAADGTYLGHIGTSADVTQRKLADDALVASEAAERKAREQAELLSGMMRELETVDGVMARSQRLVEYLVPLVADDATLEEPSAEQPLLAAAHRDGSMVGDVITPDARSQLAVPVDLGGGRRGALSLGRRNADRTPFSAAELPVMRELARHAGLLISNAQLHEREQEIAMRLQRALLPERLVQLPGATVAARYAARSDTMDVGGDWYDSYALPDGRLAVTVGDVVGHGLDAAAAMGRLRTALAAFFTHCASPARLLEQLDEFLAGPNGAEFATACCAVLDPDTGQFCYASAGHPPMLVVGPTGDTTWLTGGKSAPLFGSAGERPETSVLLEAGSLVVLYSDGLIERRGEDLQEGMARLEHAAKELCAEPVEEICRSLVELMEASSTSEDDVVVLCLRYVPISSEPFLDIFPAHPEHLAPLRAAMRAWLDQRNVSVDQQLDVLLGAGEACANAVEHAYVGRSDGLVEVQMTMGDHDEIIVTVRDNGTWRTSTQAQEGRGRGTAIMAAVAPSFGRDIRPEGTTVTLGFGGPSRGTGSG